MITHDRWQRIKEIFYSAQDRSPAERSAFLNEVCGDDASMREEVEALLAADAGNENFLTSPAYEFAAGMLASDESEFAAGQMVGRYEILCALGAGGMGQIYLARDAQLGRNIALKFISQEFATDPRRVVRFEQEARAASALSHPNVCVIHEIGITDNGRHFIAMEYIQGVTLRDHLARGPLKLLEALHIAIEVGAALASAHAVGIVHRDIKPENIMLRPDGYVKVVDFGLAKLTEFLPEQWGISEAQTIVRTEPRTLMGTVKYMSPEQLREVPVDERTDIWSLGIVLYEMLNGSTPFDARSPNDSVALILQSTPAQLSFAEDVPEEFREIVKKALDKDCADRYQTVTKLTLDLTNLKRELERKVEGELTPLPVMQSARAAYRSAGSGQEAQKSYFNSAIFTRLKSQAILTADSLFSEIRTHKAAALFAGLAASVLALFFVPGVARWISHVVYPMSSDQQTATIDHTPAMKPLTNSGTSDHAAISPNGEWVAHVEEKSGKQRLVVMNTATFVPVEAVPAETVRYLGVSFSRDSHYLYFTRAENDGPGILYQLAWPGGNPTKLTTRVNSPISFSPQGDRFAFVRYDEATSEFSLVLANVDGSNEQVLATRKDGQRLVPSPAWSPQGDIVVCPVSDWNPRFHTNLVGFNVKDGREQLIGDETFAILQVAWQEDGRSLVVSARDRDTAPHQLWRIHYPDGTAERITNNLDDLAEVSVFGRNVVTVRINLRSQLWLTSLNESQKATAIASGGRLNYGLCWTSQNKIVASTMVQESLQILRIDADGSNRVELTRAGDNRSPAASPDGRYIVFSSNRDGRYNIWRVNAEDGSDPRPLTFTDGNYYPSISPDGQWVAYEQLVGRTVSIWKVSINGGEPIKIAERYRMPVFSPDGQFIAGRYHTESGTRDVAIFSTEGGPALQTFRVPMQEWQMVQWLPNSRELSYVKNEAGHSNIWSYNLDTKKSKQLTNFNSDQIYAYAWSPDYKQIACQRVTKISDVTMITER